MGATFSVNDPHYASYPREMAEQEYKNSEERIRPSKNGLPKYEMPENIADLERLETQHYLIRYLSKQFRSTSRRSLEIFWRKSSRCRLRTWYLDIRIGSRISERTVYRYRYRILPTQEGIIRQRQISRTRFAT